MASYELYLDDPLGNRIAILDHFTKLEWTRAVNDVGGLVVTFGSEQVDWRLFGVDRRVELWRSLDTGLSRLVRVYMLRRVDRDTAENGKAAVTFAGPDVNDLLARRIAEGDAGSAETDKTDNADDMLKAVVREAMGPLTNYDRDLTPHGFTIAADVGLAPSLTKAFSRRNVLTVCQDIAKASGDLGTRLYFDVVSPTPSTLQFRTYITQRGVDRTTVRTPFSLIRGTLASASVWRDWSQEANHIYAAGQGLEADREVVHVEDDDAINASPWNRCEALADGRNYTDTESLRAFGRTVLQERRATRRFQATIADMPGSRFQLDWDFGDLISAEYDEEIFDCEVAAIRGVVTPDSETISARLDYAG